MYLRVGSRSLLWIQESKMRERLQRVVNDFDRFATSFKDSKQLAQVQEIYTKSKAALADLEARSKN